MQLRLTGTLAAAVSMVNAFAFRGEGWQPSSASCPSISPGPATLQQLAELPLLSRPHPQVESAIRHTLALYVFSVDSRHLDAFDRVFVDDVRTNYSEPLNEIIGLENVKSTIGAGLRNFAATHHSLGTQFITTCGQGHAISVTYYIASHFKTPSRPCAIQTPSSVLYATGRYEDTWKKQRDGSWKIVNRNNIFTGPLIADLQ